MKKILLVLIMALVVSLLGCVSKNNSIELKEKGKEETAMFANVTLSLMGGFVTTVQLFCLTLVFALPLGLVISFGSMSRVAPLRGLMKVLVWIVRGTPLMLQIIIIFYGPALLWNISLPRFSAALLAFILNYACYFSEIFRGGIQCVPRGQYEAGQVLGMTKTQIFFKITLMQVIKRIIPPMGNEFINLVKDTALARTIAVYEVLWMGEKFIKSAGIIWPLFYTAVFYLLFNGILILLFGWIEKKMDYFK